MKNKKKNKETCVLLRKPKCLQVKDLEVRWIGFDIEPLFGKFR